MNKITKGLTGILLSASSFIFGLTGDSKAGIVSIKNDTDASGVGRTWFYAKNIEGATEGYDFYPIDSLYSPPYQDNALEIYSKVEENKLSTDARPINTAGWNFDLAVKGSVSDINNRLRVYVDDISGLENKDIFVYNLANPGTKYSIAKDGSENLINLPNLTHGPGEYAHWRLDVVPEPSTVALLGVGGLAAMRSLGRKKRKYVDSKVLE